MKKWKKKLAARAGFSLVELIVVIVILGILAAIAVPVYTGYIDKANEAADYTQLEAIQTAAAFAYAEKYEGDVEEITSIVVTVDETGKAEVTVNGDKEVDISPYYAGTVSFKSNKFGNGAQWSAAEDDGWTELKDSET